MDFLQKKLITVKEKILHFDTLLQAHLNQQDYTSHMEKLATYLTKFRSEIEDVKKRKWHRDINDYSTGKVYNWINNYNGTDDKRFNQRRNMEYGTKSSDQVFLGQRNIPARAGVNQHGEEDVGINDPIRTRFQRKAPAPKVIPVKKKTPPQMETPS